MTDAPAVNPLAVLRSRGYIAMLVLAALIALPVSSAAYWFLQLVNDLQRWVFDDLPTGLGFSSQPAWWPLPVLAVAGAGSFAAVSALFGSPVLGAFLLMEVIGVGGAMMDLVLVPGLLASGIGALVFVGFDSWTGRGTASLTTPSLPSVGSPTGAQFGWALAIGIAAAILGTVIHRLALRLAPFAQPRIVLIGPIAGLAVGGLAAWYAVASGHGNGDVLFSGQNQLPTLLSQSSTYGVWALVGLVGAKSLAYLICLGSFRGGPVFPSMYIGAAIGIAMSHLPGLPAETGAAMGIGAMPASMLRLPLTSVLLASLLIGINSLKLLPLVIVAVVVSHVMTAWLGRPVATSPAAQT